MSQDYSTSPQLSGYVSVLIASVVLIPAWILGGQLVTVQLGSLLIATITFLALRASNEVSIKIPLCFLICLTIYILIQYSNAAYAQRWETGLRVWVLTPSDSVLWLPSSINSNFTDSSPIRFLIIFLTTGLLALTIFSQKKGSISASMLTLIAVNSTLIALVGLIQLTSDMESILGLFQAVDEGFGLFFGTFLYKNHAAAFLNLGIAASLASFFKSSPRTPKRRSNLNWLFLILAFLLLTAVIFSRSRFGFLGSLGILIVFISLALTQIRKRSNSSKWISAAYIFLAILVVGGVSFLLRFNGPRHLQTLNTQITEDFSFKQRQLAYKSEIQMFAKKPIFGWGAGNFRHGFRLFQNLDDEQKDSINPNLKFRNQNFFWQHAHNDYLEWLIELGVVGTLILFSIPGYFCWVIFKSRRWKEPMHMTLLAGLGSTIVHALIDFPFNNPAVLVTWFALLAITAKSCSGTIKYSANRNVIPYFSSAK